MAIVIGSVIVTKKSILVVPGFLHPPLRNASKSVKRLSETAIHKYTLFPLRYNNSFLALKRKIFIA